MGSGTWDTLTYKSVISTRTGLSADSISLNASNFSTEQIYKATRMKSHMNPQNVVRECCDTEEHPNTVPVILALDVTGSMGQSARIAAGKLNEIMTNLFSKVKDVEFLTMGIGDMSYDISPVQCSQFESDARICDQMLDIWFESGGGGNGFESYTAAWWFGLNHTKLDCWNRGKKGIIITLGDESLNPYLPAKRVNDVFGDFVEKDIETKELFEKVQKKFDVFHIAITDSSGYRYYEEEIKNSWGKMLGERFIISTCDNLPKTIENIVCASQSYYSNEGISW